MFQSLKNQWHRLVAITAGVRYGFPARHLTVIGVTGTDGKTTTTTMIYHILKTTGYKVACITSVGAFIGPDEIDTGFHVTTPNPWPLQRLIRRITDLGYTHLVLEVTSHGLDQYRLWGINISAAIVTNVTHEHLDYHHTYERYLAAKAKIFAHAKLVVLNADDPSYPKLKTYLQLTTRLLTYSLKRGGEWLTFLQSIFPETYNQQNALAAITLCQPYKLKKVDIRKALSTFPGVKGRMELIPNQLGIRIIVDFAHTPNGLKQALSALRTTTTGRLIAVFGAAGERDAFKRPQMGKIAAELADEVVLTAEDPRHESVYTIIRQIKSGITQNHGHIHAIIDRQKAINFAIKHLARPGDTVGIFGKGHERSLNLDGSHEIPWSDQAAVNIALNL